MVILLDIIMQIDVIFSLGFWAEPRADLSLEIPEVRKACFSLRISKP